MNSLINRSNPALHTLGCTIVIIFLFIFSLFIADHSKSKRPHELPGLDQFQNVQIINPKPLVFEQNNGQIDESVKFLSRAKGYDLLLLGDEAIINLKSASSNPVTMKLVGAKKSPEVRGQNVLIGKTNYLVGNDKSKWRSNISNYESVKFEEIYQGIDLVYYGDEKQIEFDFLVSPGMDPQTIKFKLEGPDNIELDNSVNLVMHLGPETMAFQAPVLYQEIGGETNSVKGEFALLENSQIGFQVGDYDAEYPLVIDPVLIYSTYIGGNGNDTSMGIHVDNDGNMILVGNTWSTTFPVGPDVYMLGAHKIFVTKLLGNGSDFEFTTFLGGRSNDSIKETALDPDGNIYIAGYTESDDYPVENAYQTMLAGGEGTDAFISKIKPDGSGFVYSTYLGGWYQDGGFANDEAHDIAVDQNGNAYITGMTESMYFDTTAGAFQTMPGLGEYSGATDAFVSKFDANGKLVYSTYLGGLYKRAGYPVPELSIYSNEIGTAIVVDDDGSVFVAGTTDADLFYKTTGKYRENRLGENTNIFITKLNPTGSDVLYSTFFGGTKKDRVNDMYLSGFGTLVFAGYTDSDDYPTNNRAFQDRLVETVDLPQNFEGWKDFSGGDCFVTAILKNLETLHYSTYFGGGNRESINKIAGDDLGFIHATGFTFSNDFPTTGDALKDTLAGVLDPFVLKLDPGAGGAGSLVYSSYFGGKDIGAGIDIDVDDKRNLYVTGWTRSDDIPVTENALQDTLEGALMPGGVPFGDGFVAKIGKKDYIQIRKIYPDPNKDLWLPHTLRPGKEWQFSLNLRYALFASNRGDIDIKIVDDTGNVLDSRQIQDVIGTNGLFYNNIVMNKITVPEIEESDSLFVKVYLTPDNHASPIDSAIIAYKIVVHKWTFMFYMNADGNLEPFAIRDLIEMANVGSNDSLAIVLLVDRHPKYFASPVDWADSRYIAIRQNNKFKDKSMGELDMGAPRTLQNFVKWGQENFPAEKFALVLWDHGGGWMTQNNTALKKPNPTLKFPLSPPGINEDLETYLDVGPDETSNNTLWSLEIKHALAPLPKLDILWFSTCLTGMIENAFQFRHAADYFVASEDNMPATGSDNNIFFSTVKDNPDMSPAEIAKWIVQSYGAVYAKDRVNITMSAIKTSKVEKVVQEVDYLAELLIDKEPWAEIDSALAGTLQFPPNHYRDLYHFALNLKEESGDPEIRLQCDRIMGSLYEATVEKYGSKPEENAYGLSIYFPTSVGAFDERYIEIGNIEFTDKTLWDEFLIFYILSENLPPGVEGPIIDTYEVNDTFTQAYGPLLSNQKYLSYIPYAGDTDFYYFSTGLHTSVSVKLTSPIGINYDLNVLDGNQQIIASSSSIEGIDSLYISNLLPGTFYLEIVTNDNFFEHPYKLELVYDGSGIGQIPLSFDDGQPDGGRYSSDAGEVIGSNFRAPTYPMKLDEVSFFISSTDGANSGGDGSFYLWLADYYGTKIDPFKVTPSGMYINSSAQAGGWFTVDLSDRDINLQSEFFIGIGYDGENTPVLGMDPFDNGQTFHYDDSTQTWQALPNTAFIRAKARYLESPHTVSFLMPETVYGLPGQAISVPLDVSNLNDSTIDSLEMELTFDPSILQFDFISFENTINSDWTINEMDTSLTGRVNIRATGGTPISNDETLLSANFQVKSNAALGDSGEVIMERLLANGGQLYTTTRNTKIFVSDGSLVDVQPALPHDFELYQNYPNPFNPTTTIDYQVPKSGHVQITISDMLGRHIKTLVNSNHGTGRYSTMWNATDENNRSVAAGLYFCKMEGSTFSDVKKMLLLK
jgi:hypothetical protein